MGQQDPAPAIIVSGSTGWRRGPERMPKLGAKTEEGNLRVPRSVVAPRSRWNRGGRDREPWRLLPRRLPEHALWRWR